MDGGTGSPVVLWQMPSKSSLAAPDASVLDRYLKGELTAQESLLVDQWLKERPEEREALLAIQLGVGALRGPLPSYDADARAAAIVESSLRTVRQQRRDADLQSRFPSRKPWRPSAWKKIPHVLSLSHTLPTVIGSVMLAFFMVLGWQWYSQRGAGPFPDVASRSMYTTGNGERSTITLPDGSTVILSVASQLEVPSDYDRGNRVLRLTGEALFTVAHKHGAPFSVLAGTSVTRVLGTSFVVRHYPSDTAARVTVRDGKISVQSSVLMAGQQVTVGRMGVSPVRLVDVTQLPIVSGMLTFDDVPLVAAIPELNRWYNVEIKLADSALEQRRILGDFPPGSQTDLADILATAFRVQVVREGRTLTLSTRK